MLETINKHAQNRSLPLNKRKTNSHERDEGFHNFVTVDFKEDRRTFGSFRSRKFTLKNQMGPFTNTVYGGESLKWRQPHINQVRRSGRYTAFTDR
jgi:hypothetical protein